LIFESRFNDVGSKDAITRLFVLFQLTLHDKLAFACLTFDEISGVLSFVKRESILLSKRGTAFIAMEWRWLCVSSCVIDQMMMIAKCFITVLEIAFKSFDLIMTSEMTTQISSRAHNFSANWANVLVFILRFLSVILRFQDKFIILNTISIQYFNILIRIVLFKASEDIFEITLFS
jgi:hypothetical protein